MTLTPERIADLVKRLRRAVSNLPPVVGPKFKRLINVANEAADALSTPPPAEGVTEEMVEAGARIACVQSHMAQLENHMPDDDVVLSYSQEGTNLGKRWEAHKDRVRTILEAALASKPIAKRREHDFDNALGPCKGCGLYVEQLIDQRYCSGAKPIAGVERLLDHVREIKLAAGRYRLAIHSLSRIKDGKTLFEGSPTKDQECFEAWLELNDSGVALDQLITFRTAGILKAADALASKPIAKNEMLARFFIDHDMIHDRASGKHVCTEKFQFECRGGSLEATCAMLNDIFNYGVITCIGILDTEVHHAEECLAVPNLTEAARREAKCWHDGVFFAKKKLERRLADVSAIDSYPLALRHEAKPIAGVDQC